MNKKNLSPESIDEMLLTAEPSVIYFARRLHRFDHLDVDDVAQELRISVLELIDRYDPAKGATWKTFVNVQLHYRSLDLVRVHGCKTRSGYTRHVDTQSTEQMIDGERRSMEAVYDVEPGAVFDWNEFSAKTIHESTAVRCQVLYAEGLRMHEIGNRLGISESRVSQVMAERSQSRAEAIARLRVLLGEVA